MKKEIDYITNFDHRPSNIYGLPKVHKYKEIIDAIKQRPAECIKIVCPESLTMRPIIAGPHSVTSRLSDFTDKLLRPYLKVVKSYIRDDIDFLLKMPQKTSDKKILATFDVTNMHTNIDNNLGQEEIRFWLEKHPKLIPRNITKDFIPEGLKIVLECNVFTFDNRTYLQIRGTAMGTKCVPVYVTLVMANLELKLIKPLRKSTVLTLVHNFKTNGEGTSTIVSSTGTQRWAQ